MFGVVIAAILSGYTIPGVIVGAQKSKKQKRLAKKLVAFFGWLLFWPALPLLRLDLAVHPQLTSSDQLVSKFLAVQQNYLNLAEEITNQNPCSPADPQTTELLQNGVAVIDATRHFASVMLENARLQLQEVHKNHQAMLAATEPPAAEPASTPAIASADGQLTNTIRPSNSSIRAMEQFQPITRISQPGRTDTNSES